MCAAERFCSEREGLGKTKEHTNERGKRRLLDLFGQRILQKCL